MAGLKYPHRFLAPSPVPDTGCDGDFDESDIWGFGPEPKAEDRRKPITVRRSGTKKMEKGDRAGGAAAGSLPVNIPDWSKILKEENRGVVARGRGRQFFEYDEGDEEGMGAGSVIPPHELLWRRREASFSVQEGIGRTLKGRDLSRVRDAILQRTGFQD